MSVLVDSSIWIAAANKKTKEFWQLSKLIRNNYPISICPMIRMEVCQGAKTQVQFDKLWESFLGFYNLPLSEHLWEASAWNYFQCRKKGITVGSNDCLIATLSLEHRMPLWSKDRDFQYMQKALPLDLADIDNLIYGL